MSVNNKRVFYVKYLAHPVYAEILASRSDVRLDRLENESSEAIFAPILSEAHAYQIGAARDELAPHFHVHADLLRRAPNLLIVSGNGAGFDPVDVEACTAAGVTFSMWSRCRKYKRQSPCATHSLRDNAI